VPEVKPERSGWRDLAFSLRHRAWGYDAPLVDIDFMVVEYDRREPVALISYKREDALPDSPANLEAFRRLGAKACLPTFEVRYASDFARFQPISLTVQAQQLMRGFEGCSMPELEYVQWLYWLRGRIPPADVLQRLKVIQ
jgi:hypothetical protein